MKFPVALESIIANAIISDSWILIFKWVAQAVAFSAVVALMVWGVLVPTSLTSNSGSWASFLSRSDPLPAANCNASSIVAQNIAPNKFGCILVQLYVACEALGIASVHRSQGTIDGSVFLPSVTCNSCFGMLSSRSQGIMRWLFLQGLFGELHPLLVVQNNCQSIDWLFSRLFQIS